MFSHTHKGQHYNMELLSKFLHARTDAVGSVHPRLIDYELLTDDKGARTVGFGWFAGGAFLLHTVVKRVLNTKCSRWCAGVSFGTCAFAARDWRRFALPSASTQF